MDRKAISERLEAFFNEKHHIAMQNTPPKQESNIMSMTHETENQTFLPQFYTIFRTPTSTYFISPSLVFRTDSISVKISSNIFGFSRICTKYKACTSRLMSTDHASIGLDQDWSQFWPDQDWIGLQFFWNLADQDGIGLRKFSCFNVIIFSISKISVVITVDFKNFLNSSVYLAMNSKSSADNILQF